MFSRKYVDGYMKRQSGGYDEPVYVFPGMGCPQIARCKPIFNERTDWILEDFFIHRTWEKNHRQNIMLN